MERFKYPRTPHMPWTFSKSNDDKVLISDDHFYRMDAVVVTTKMDGENTTVYPDGYCHARSVDSKHRSYHSWLMRDIYRWSYKIPFGCRLCGEYLFAEHSIAYKDLESYFLAFSMWFDKICLSWNELIMEARELDIKTVPVLYIGKYDREKIVKIAQDQIFKGQEGIVVRNADSFYMEDTAMNIAKCVRPNHVQTTEHWMNGVIKQNGLVS